MELLLFFQGLRTPALDSFFLGVTHLAQEAAVLMPVLLFYWCLDKKVGLRLALVYFAGGWVNQLAKLVVCMPRPFMLDQRILPNEAALRTATGYSFPSGHTTSAASLAMGLGLSFKKAWVWIVCGLYVALVALSRMMLGVHTLLDVAAAVLLTAAMALVAERILRQLEDPRKARLYFCLGLAASLLLSAFAAVRVLVNGVPAAQAADAFKTSGAAAGMVLGLALDRKALRFSTQAGTWAQLVKMLAGTLSTLLIMEGLKGVLGGSLPMQFVRYLITVLFVTVGYPALFTLVLGKRKAARPTA